MIEFTTGCVWTRYSDDEHNQREAPIAEKPESRGSLVSNRQSLVPQYAHCSPFYHFQSVSDASRHPFRLIRFPVDWSENFCRHTPIVFFLSSSRRGLATNTNPDLYFTSHYKICDDKTLLTKGPTTADKLLIAPL